MVVCPLCNCVQAGTWFVRKQARSHDEARKCTIDRSHHPDCCLPCEGHAPCLVRLWVRRWRRWRYEEAFLLLQCTQVARQPTCCLLFGLSTHPWIHIVDLIGECDECKRFRAGTRLSEDLSGPELSSVCFFFYLRGNGSRVFGSGATRSRPIARACAHVRIVGGSGSGLFKVSRACKLSHDMPRI